MLRRLLPLLLLLPTPLIGCAARRPGEALGRYSMGAEIAFAFPEGERGLRRIGRRPTRRAIQNAMAHPGPRWQSFLVPGLIEPAWLDRDTLDEDAYRIEIWYANQGFFDARFLGWEVIPRGNQRKALKKVALRAYIDEGEPSRIRTITSAGEERLTRPLQRRVEAMLGGGPNANLAVNTVFTYDAWQDALDAVRTLLAERSYAHATVEGDVAVFPDEHAVDLTVRIAPGPSAKFGPVTIEGLANVPEGIVRDQLTIEPGAGYSASALATTRAKLYALRVFGVVDVIPDLSDPTSAVVPVRIQVTEAKARELRAGPVLQVEPGTSSVALQASYRDDNVFGRLWRLEQEATVGAAAIVDNVAALPSLEATDVKPIVDVQGSVELPHLFGSTWTLRNEGRVELGLERGYRYFSPSFAPTLLYTGFETLRPSAGYRIRYYDYFEQTIDDSAIENSPLGLDLTDPYLLSMLEQRVVYDGRNDPLNTTRGWYWSLAFAEAGGPFGGNFQFLRGAGEVRAYRGIVDLFGWDPDVVFAGRLGGGIIVPYGAGEEASVPYAERLYLGGSTTVRGWGANRLGPYICLNEAEECPNLVDQIPAGGQLQLYGNFEVRKGGLPFGLVAAAFVDVGRVWDRPSWFGFDELQWSVGGGLRYGTPVGPIRLDVGFRLGRPEYFAAQSPWGLHLSLAEAF
ncbi:MAG: outer membrane protein assembly factor [Myxococcota bacterium]